MENYTMYLLGYLILIICFILFYLYHRHTVAKLELLAGSHELTGLPNRRELEASAQVLFGQMHRGAHAYQEYGHRKVKEISLVFIDLDRFKILNDTYGHQAGDEVLCSFAEILKKAFRETDVVAHVGGDEYVVLVPGSSREETAKIIDRVHEMLNQCALSFCEDSRDAVSFTWGMATTSDTIMTYKQLYNAADKVMYKIKRRKKQDL